MDLVLLSDQLELVFIVFLLLDFLPILELEDPPLVTCLELIL